MKPLTFGQSALLGFFLSVLGTMSFQVISLFMPLGFALRGVMLLLVASYLVVVMVRHPRKTGVLAIPSMLLMMNCVLWVSGTSIWVTLVLNVMALSAVRSVYAYQSLILATADMLISMIALFIALAVFSYQQSIFLSFWSFFLVQALTAFLPVHFTLKTVGEKRSDYSVDSSFQRAQRQAERALDKLVNQ